ncbi:MAG: hypothetical protein KBC64_07540 [Simkaniaceae bacterium]|nr:hypothetical protein [Simkaniaceae bacterium]
MSITFDATDSITLEGSIYKPAIGAPGTHPFHYCDNIKILLNSLLGYTSLASKISKEFSKKILATDISSIHDLSATYYPRSCAVTVVINQRLRGELPLHMVYVWKAAPLSATTPLLNIN